MAHARGCEPLYLSPCHPCTLSTCHLHERAYRNRRHGRPLPRGRCGPRPLLAERGRRRRLLPGGARRPLDAAARAVRRPARRPPGLGLLHPRLLPRPVRRRTSPGWRIDRRLRRRTRPAVPPRPRRRRPGVAVAPRRRASTGGASASSSGNICLPTDKANDLCREVPRRPISACRRGRPDAPAQPVRRRAAGRAARQGARPRRRQLHARRGLRVVACTRSSWRADELLAGPGRRHARRRGQPARLPVHADGVRPAPGALRVRPVRPVRRRADGLMVGEGAGVFVLKRLADALRARRPHPRRDRRRAACRTTCTATCSPRPRRGNCGRCGAAYEQAGWQPPDVDLIECHATGTPGRRRGRVREPARTLGRRRLGAGPVRDRVGEVHGRPPAHRGRGGGGGQGAPGDRRPRRCRRRRTSRAPADGLRYAGGPFRVLTRSRAVGAGAGRRSRGGRRSAGSGSAA